MRCLRTVPQLVFQGMYSLSIGQVTDTAAFAFCASILSVISTLLSFLIDRSDEEIKVMEYYLVTECMRTSLGSSTLEARSNDITRDERMSILRNRGRPKALSFSLAALWEIQPKRIEIGQTLLTKQGARTHVVHYLYESELNGIDPLFYVQQFYASSSEEISQILRAHFSLNHFFFVRFVDKTFIEKRTTISRMLSLSSMHSDVDSFDGNDRASRLENAINAYLDGETEDADLDDIKNKVLMMMMERKKTKDLMEMVPLQTNDMHSDLNVHIVADNDCETETAL